MALSGSRRLKLSRSQSKATGPDFASGSKLTNQSKSISTSDRRFGGKSGKQSISGPGLGKRGK